MNYLSKLPVIDPNWFIDRPGTDRGISIGIITFREIFEGKPGLWTFPWSINASWLNQKKKKFIFKY
jgi:hypothetical protein